MRELPGVEYAPPATVFGDVTARKRMKRVAVRKTRRMMIRVVRILKKY